MIATGGIGGVTGKGGATGTGGMIATGGTGGVTGKGGATGMGGTVVGAGGSTGTGACAYPACYTDLLSSCIPGGTCVQQSGYMCGAVACPEPLTSVPTSMISNVCYSNGVKNLTSIDMTSTASMVSVTTVTKNGTLCYSYEMPYAAATSTSATMVFKNSAGATVVTYVISSTDRTATITCTGKSPVVVSLDCGSTPDGGTSSDGGTGCTTGTCAP
jgi:hypothetical protein